MIAFVVASNPSAYPCGSCQCGPEGENPGGWIIPELKNEDGTPWETRVCPRFSMDPAAVELIRVWKFWKKGVLLVAGGLLDQPARYIEAMELLDYLKADADAERTRSGHGNS